MKNKKILFRADSSSSIGTGHIMRDLVLATQYPDSEIIFATQNLEGNLNAKIVESGYQVKHLLSNELEELVNMVNELQVEMIVIDHYGIDYAFEKALKEQTDITIMVLDDTYEKHHCDILLNHNIYGDATRYEGLVPTSCELRCGEEYTLIRDEFKIAKANKKPLPSKPITLFVAMGGSDSQGLTLPILEVLEKFSDVHVHVVTTHANAQLEMLKTYVKKHTNITLHIDTNQMANLMAQSHIAILTPSVILNEASFMELLFIPIQTADNQKEMVVFLEANEYPVIKTFDAEVLFATLHEFIWFYNQRNGHE